MVSNFHRFTFTYLSLFPSPLASSDPQSTSKSGLVHPLAAMKAMKAAKAAEAPKKAMKKAMKAMKAK